MPAAADADHNRVVDLTDFTILAANFNTAGQAFSQGNFDYDAAGTVDLTDFTILARELQQHGPRGRCHAAFGRAGGCHARRLVAWHRGDQ